nr:MAG TPA: hypothetical protein [Caudoviricetes sp.]
MSRKFLIFGIKKLKKAFYIASMWLELVSRLT